MNLIASGFITLCILLIAGSIGLLLVFSGGFAIPEAAAIAMGSLVILVTIHFQILRKRDRDMQLARYEDLTDQVSEMLDDITGFRLRLEEIERSVGEKATVVADARAKAQMRPLLTEQEILGELVKQVAEATSGLDDRVMRLEEHVGSQGLSQQSPYRIVSKADHQSEIAGAFIPAVPTAAPPTQVAVSGEAPSVCEPAPNSAAADEEPDLNEVLDEHGSDDVPDPAAAIAESERAPQEPEKPEEEAEISREPAREEVAEKPEVGPSAQELRGLIRDNHLTLYLQAIMSLPERRIRFYEAFARFDTKTRSMAAADFIEAATRHGLVPAIDNLMVYRSADLVRRLRERTPEIGVFCNLSPSSLSDARFFEGLATFIDDNRDLKDNLFFEFTQKDFDSFSPLDEGNYEAIRDLGFGFSVDQVNNLQVDFRQYGRKGVRFIKTSAAVLLSALANKKADIHPADLDPLLQRFGIDLIVDKIETEAQNVELLDYSARYGQGFLLAPAKPIRTDPTYARRGLVDSRRKAAQ